MRIETVEIKGQDGKPVIINKSDFDEKKHELMNRPKGRPKKDK